MFLTTLFSKRPKKLANETTQTVLTVNGNVKSYNLTIIQEYFQPKTGRKIRIFSLVRKNNILFIFLKKCICMSTTGRTMKHN